MGMSSWLVSFISHPHVRDVEQVSGAIVHYYDPLLGVLYICLARRVFTFFPTDERTSVGALLKDAICVAMTASALCAAASLFVCGQYTIIIFALTVLLALVIVTLRYVAHTIRVSLMRLLQSDRS